MGISERKKRILKAVIDDYIETAEPVGSKAIAQHAGLGLSSATIRNEMAELEALGYLEQPHTSAGRIPSIKGYRVYVNELMHRHKLSIEETEEINRGLHMKMQKLDHVMSDVGKLTSKLTSYPTFALTTSVSHNTITRFDLIYVDPGTFIIVAMLSNNTVKNKLVQIPAQIEPQALIKLATVFNASFTKISESQITSQLIANTERAVGDEMGLVAVIAGFAIEILSENQSGEAYFSGTSHLLKHPEYRDVDKAQKLLSYLSTDNELLRLPMPDKNDGDVKITIGPENLADELKDSSVVVAKYDIGDNMQGLIGVVGPTRMDYSKIEAKLSYIAHGIGNLLSGKENTPPKLKGRADYYDDDEEI